MKNKIILGGIVMILLLSIVLALTNEANQTNLILENTTILNESFLNNIVKEKLDVIVVFKEKIDEDLLEKDDIEIKENLESIDVSAIKATPEAIKEIQNDPNVESVELDIDLELFGEENAIDLEEQIIPWGVERINAHNAWNRVTGKDIKIAVIDSGIDKYHPDLEENIVGGVSFINNTKYWNDDLGHGTSIAGVISALNNKIGIVGVAPESELYSVKVIGSSGGKLSNFIQGIQWAIDNDMDIVVMGLGIPVDSPSLRRIVDKAYLEGIVLVAASGKDNQIYYPAKYSSVIAVGSIDKNNELTNENGEGNELEFVAPGQNIISTNINGYGSFDGTSMSAPHVAGVLALLKENDPSLNVNELRAKLQRDAIDLGEEGKDEGYGYGLIYINLEEEKLDAMIQMTFPEEENLTKKEELEIKPIKVEIIRIEDESENVVQTLFYDGNQGVQNISVESGQYKVKQYFDDGIYSNDYIVNEGETVVVPLHKVDPPVHQWIAKEAFGIWPKDVNHEIYTMGFKQSYNSKLDIDGYDSINNDEGILIGSGEEDKDVNGEDVCTWGSYKGPACWHFWEPDDPEGGDYDDGVRWYGSSYVRAQTLWDTKVIPFYNSGNKDEAYYWLGRVAHLLEDATVPAHVHKDAHFFGNDDSFEEFMKKKSYSGWPDVSGKYNFQHFNGLNYMDQQYNYENLIPGFDWEDVKTDSSNLFKLFWYTAQKTQYYASDDVDGNDFYRRESDSTTKYSFNSPLWQNDEVTIISKKKDLAEDDDNNEGTNVSLVSDANIPHAMKAVAGLYRLFWAEVDADGDNVNNLFDNCIYNSNANQANNDGDSEGDVCDSDDDNDGILDVNDAFPFDPTEWNDNDNDGIGDNADEDDDNDGVLDDDDEFPFDPTEWNDNDNDGTGDNADEDDDNDGILDISDSCNMTYGQDYEQGCPDLILPIVSLNLSDNFFLGNENVTITCEVNDTDPSPIHELIITKPSNETISLNCSTATFTETDEEGNYSVRFTATDGGNNSANETDTFFVDLCLTNWVEVNTECREGDFKIGWFNDTNTCYATTNLTSDLEDKPQNITYDYSCDYDGDGFIGDISNVNTTITNLSLESKNGTIEFREGNNTLIEFEFNLSDGIINFVDIFVERQDNESSFGYIIIKGLNLTSQNQTKTVYFDKKRTANNLCIRDEEVANIFEMSLSCTDENETSLNCPESKGGYSCETISETKYKVSGLFHSAIKEYTVPSSGGDTDGGGGGGGGGGGSSYIRAATTTKTNTTSNQTTGIIPLASNDTGTFGEENQTQKGGTSPITGATIGTTIKRWSLPIVIFIVLVIGSLVGVRARNKRKGKSKNLTHTTALREKNNVETEQQTCSSCGRNNVKWRKFCVYCEKSLKFY